MAQWSPGRYRWRTKLRSALPSRPPLYALVLKGSHSCGNHEWYNHDNIVDHCYHCVAEQVRRTE